MTWQPTDTVTEFADYLRVTMDGKDITFYRDMLTIPTDWQRGDPYGSLSATVVIPSVTGFEAPEANPWLTEGASVRFDFVKDGAVLDPADPPFYGLVDSIDRGGSATIVECSGWVNGILAGKSHQPSLTQREAKDGGAVLWAYIDQNRRLAMTPTGGPVTNIPLATQGSRDMSGLGYVDHVLGNLVNQSGDSWTLLPDRAKSPRTLACVQRPNVATADVDFTIYYGAHGVKVDMRRDRLDMTNRVYGEGVASSGERWRNAMYPRIVDAPVPTFPGTMSLGTTDADTITGSGVSVLARRLRDLNLLEVRVSGIDGTFTDDVEDAVKDFQRGIGVTLTGVVTSSLWGKLYGEGFTAKSFGAAFFAPLASDPRVEYWLTGPNGTRVGLNPDYDASLIPVEQFVGYGEGTGKRHAKKNARGIIARAGSLVGTITLTSDPAEMSRFQIREGMVGRVMHYLGGTTKVYVSSTQVGWASGSQAVTLAVAETAKHYLELAAIKQRRMDARQDPGKHFRHQLRRSSQTSDAITGWEGESGAGIVADEPLIGGRWNVFQMTAAQLGVIGDWQLSVKDPTAWIMALFADKVGADVLGNVLGNPHTWRGTDENRLTTFQTHEDWVLADERLMIEAWGDPDTPCGYEGKPHMRDGKVTTHPLTGKFRDKGSWEFWTARGFLWVAVWPLADCTMSGRARIQLTEGV